MNKSQKNRAKLRLCHLCTFNTIRPKSAKKKFRAVLEKIFLIYFFLILHIVDAIFREN